MSIAEIDAVVAACGASTRRAVEAGFEVIDIHAAHGYLIHSFLSPVANHRNDQYGGDLRGRMRLALEIASSVRANIPDRVPLFFRVSCVDWRKDLDNRTDEAEAILQGGQADLIAIGREALMDPHWGLHAAQALGVDPDWDKWPPMAGGYSFATKSASRMFPQNRTSP